jgi:hypothetical protein
VGRFCEVSIVEGIDDWWHYPIQTFTADQLVEVERSDKWPMSTDIARNHRTCRRWAGETCGDDVLDVGSSAEWHGTLLYTPQQQTPGADVPLTIQARVARAGESCGAPLTFVLGYSGKFDRLGPAPRGYAIVNRLSVHLGEEPLPKFDQGWAYGDLHYHSQGTDNEGESAYAYRPTLQAMRAMGLDFLFATDHASDSAQMTDVDKIIVDNVDLDVDGPWWAMPVTAIVDALADLVEAFVEKKEITIGAESDAAAARDMNPQRFARMLGVLNDAGGANAEVMRLPGRKGAPRIFLGGEVDVIPEMSPAEKAAGVMRYGNGRGYAWRSGCTALPAEIQQFEEFTSLTVCETADALGDEISFEGDRYLLQDVQGLGESYHFARQHLLHLPVDPTRADAFVSGHTGLWGGATRRLGPAMAQPGYEDEQQSVLYRDYEVERKGYAFLAHPMETPSGNGIGRLGPDVLPYTDVQLKTAFESQWVLGLQLWNEDTRLNSGGTGPNSIHGFPVQPEDEANDEGNRFWWARWSGSVPKYAYQELHDGLVTWDRMLTWGIRPSQTAGLSWLPAGQPRRVFMAGGSDAHGDWNFRRQGRLTGLSAVTDSALGKPRNLLHVGLERHETVTDGSGTPYGAVGQGQVTSTLAEGNFSVTDGPALRIALDRNHNGIIDDSDVPMGGVAGEPSRGTWLPFVVEWKSTDEFGPVAAIDLYVGVTNDGIDTAFVYASANHGIHSEITPPGSVKPDAYLDKDGGSHWELKDGYMLDPTGRLRITPTAAEAKAGRRVVSLRANDFVVGRRRVVDYGDPVCTWSDQNCAKPGHGSDEGCDLICTEPPPDEYQFNGLSLPDRMFVRAFARTAPKGGTACGSPTTFATRKGLCIERLAFTNPIWVDNTTVPPPPPPPPTPGFSVECAPAKATTPVGTSVVGTCTVTSKNDFSKPVTLGCPGLPAGVACAFTPASVTPAANRGVASSLTISVGASARPGSFTIRVAGVSTILSSTCPLCPPTTITSETAVALTVTSTDPAPAPGGLVATFDPARRAPSCGVAGSSCDTGVSLVLGRGLGGREPNAPSTIGATCQDGEVGPTTERWNATDRIRVSTADGGTFAPGQTVRIDATVWASLYKTALDTVDFFYAPDAGSPAWRLIGSATLPAAGVQRVSAFYTLPAGASQAVRLQVRQQGTAVACNTGTTSERDDLVFAVGGTP